MTKTYQTTIFVPNRDCTKCKTTQQAKYTFANAFYDWEEQKTKIYFTSKCMKCNNEEVKQMSERLWYKLSD